MHRSATRQSPVVRPDGASSGADALHVVWDWNGTLFDDFHLVVESVSAAVAPFGLPAITPNDYRDHYERPVIGFYAKLLGRPVSGAEWVRINDGYFRRYEALVDSARLTVDADAAFLAVADAGGTQSLLSMWYHDRLVPTAADRGVTGHMTRVDGVVGDTADTKAGHLAEHLTAIGRGRVVVIGDALDDAVAAAEIGVPAVLYDGGSHHRSELEASGAPVAATLVEAVALAQEVW